MSDETRFELISAYFDDELSSDERLRAEQLLAGDPSLQEYLTELQQMQSEWSALPQMKLGDGFADQVLAQVVEQPVGVDESADQVNPNRWGRYLAVAAAVAATAAALYLAVTLTRGGNDDPNPNLVQQDPPKDDGQTVPDGGTPDGGQDPDGGVGSETQLVDAVEFAGVPVRAVVMAEFQLTAQGARDRVFDEVLNRFEIPLRDTREVDGPAISAIEKSQMFGGKPGDATPMGSVRMAVVLASIKQHTEIIEWLAMQDDAVSGARFNVSLHSTDFDVFREFNRVNQAVTKTAPAKDMVEVFQFALNDALESMLLQRSVKPFAKLSSSQFNTTAGGFAGERQVPLIYLVRSPQK